MRKLFLIVSALFCLSATLSAQELQNSKSIDVRGYYEKEFTPDRIYVGFTIKENLKDKNSVEELQTQMVKRLKQLGIDIEKQLTIKDMYGNVVGKNPRKSEVLQTRNYELLLTDAQAVSEVYSALQELKVNSLRINRVELSTYEEEKLKIMGQAVRNARRVAEVLAQNAACEISDVLKIVCHESLGHGYLGSDFVMLKSTRSAGESSNTESVPAVEFRKIKISSSVEVCYGIK